jgi:hypothetical protein
MTTIVHVNRSLIAFNLKHRADLPVYTIKRGGKTLYAFAVEITGPSRLVDTRSARQLSCGARAWIETEAEVVLRGEMTWAEVQRLRAQTLQNELEQAHAR